MSDIQLDYYVPTGYMIQEYLDLNNMAHEEFAQALDMTVTYAEKLLTSELPLTSEIAEQISKLFNIDSKYFIEYEQSYREFLKKQKK